MKVEVVSGALGEVKADAVVVGMSADDKKLPAGLAALDRQASGRIAAVLAAEKFQGKPGAVTHLHVADGFGASRIVVTGLGSRTEMAAEMVRRAAAAGVRRARDLGARTVALDVLGDRLPARERAHAAVEGAVLGTYVFDRYKREKSEKAVETLRVVAPDRRQTREVTEGARRGEVFAEGTWLARDLINAPANDVHPTYVAEVARQIAREGKLKIKVLERDECAKLGMGAFLGVAKGSEQPPKFIHLTYTPSGRATKRVAIVGKGITFDSGGLDLKSAEGMARMKNDMSGAAAVLGIMKALPKLGARVEVHGLIAATENMPSGSAIRPGDILRAMNGTTIEIGNTDAEGRLTLADALCYAAKFIEPQEMIDMATLTGACVVALGALCSGLFANDQRLADRLLASARAAGERAWQLPLIDEYKEQFKSDVADLNNTGGRNGGAITAGLFIKEFAGTIPWAHLDIAGPAFIDKDSPLGPKGATGVGVRTLLTYLSDGK
ncbi:MAG: leucyl aminopeptidase [Candidatus Rokubacteria bacterium]|nr:leucyl aminopeptidase [Candidatus Rokubacteria bacterium]